MGEPGENTPKADTVMPDDYTLIDKIGQGGYGLVYKAEHKRTGQYVALKTIRVDDTDPDKRKNRIARFEREADLCAQINHPNIVKLLDRGYSTSGQPYAVFELVEGKTLKDLILAEKKLSPDLTKEIMIQVLDALERAHAQGIIHRDLKPHNIMISQMASRPHVKILDFGIGAFSKEFRSVDYQTLTLTQEVLGTPNYSAPEQLRGEAPTQRTDLYAWALILVECLMGRPLIKGQSIAEVFQQQLMPTEVSLPAFVLSHPLAGLLRRVLKKNPQHRAFDAQSVLDEMVKINFTSLEVPDTNEGNQADDVTAVNLFSGSSSTASRKQITVLSLKLNLVPVGNATQDLEILDAIEKDQLNLFKDIVMRYGGHIGGTLCNHMLAYFGFPETHDTDARRAARAAMELQSQVEQQASILLDLHGLKAELRLALHSGITLVFANQTPEGNVPNTAFELLHQVPAGTILATEHSHKLLEPYVTFSDFVQIRLTNTKRQLTAYIVKGQRDGISMPLLRTQSLEREMMGRAKEKTALKTAWKSSENKGQTLILQGQAGIGKSRLLHEFSTELKSKNTTVIEFRCLPEQQNNALYPFLSMFRALWQLENEEDKVSRVSTVLQAAGLTDEKDHVLFCSWLSLQVPNGEILSQIPPEEQKQHLFHILEALIRQIDPSFPSLIVLEDVHWIDPSSKEFIEFLIQNMGRQTGMLLLTSRPQKRTVWENVKTIDLTPLEEEACAGIISSIVPGRMIAPEAIRYILLRTDGIPLYAEELTSMLLEQDYLIEENGTYKLTSEIDEQAIPGTLQDLLNARLDRLGPAKETAQMAATIGREFDLPLLAGTTDQTADELKQHLDLLQQADILMPIPDEKDRYLFRHALISDAAYHSMTRSFRRGIHKRIALTLEEQFSERVTTSPFLLARHLYEGRVYDKAVHYGLQASTQAVEKSASQEAIINAEKVLKWAKKLEKEAEITNTVELYSVLSSAHMQKGGWAAEEVSQYTEKAIDLLRNSERYDELTPHLWWKILGGVVAGENEGLAPVHQEMDGYLTEINALNRSAVKCAQAFLITALGQKDVWKKSIQLCEEALVFFEQVDQEERKGHESIFGFSVPVFARALMGMALNTAGDREAAIRHTEQMLVDARASGSIPTIGIALMYAAEIYKLHADCEKIRLFTQELVALSQKHDMPVYEAYGQMQLDWANDSLENEESTFKILYDERSMFSLAHYQSHYAETYAHQGDFEKALAKVEKSIAIDEKIKHHYYLARLYYLKGRYLCELGQKEAAHQELKKGLSMAKAQGSLHYEKEIETFMETVDKD